MIPDCRLTRLAQDPVVDCDEPPAEHDHDEEEPVSCILCACSASQTSAILPLQPVI